MNTAELNAIAVEYGTPTFLFDTEALRKRMADIKEIVGEKVHLCYSIKANPFLIPAMLECVEKLEVCSPGELCICERLQVAPERIIYSGVSKREIDVEEALEYGADVYTAESLGHVKRLNAEAVKRGVVIPVILRLSAGSQFGMSKEDLCYVIAHRADYTGIMLEGIHYFAGTQRKKLAEQVNELAMLEALFTELKETYDYEVKKLEYGPGLPVPYFSNEDFSDTLAPLKEVAPALQKIAEKVHLTVEMG
ncbi:MAG: alanine racemase, partial [Lachnospiraceae bacterium]|nr:alanine racemase [Lachnospiraceae bacterium]